MGKRQLPNFMPGMHARADKLQAKVVLALDRTWVSEDAAGGSAQSHDLFAFQGKGFHVGTFLNFNTSVRSRFAGL